jgi:hypothetical protein
MPVERRTIKSMMNRLMNMEHKMVAPRANVAKHRHHQRITKILVSAAIALGCFVALAAPASANPNAVGTDPNPFGTLGCNCRETAPAGSPALRDETNRGIRESLSVSVPGRPAPAHLSQPQP